MENPKQEAAQRMTGRIKLLLVILVCAAPMILSYLTYYVIKPEGRNNYGALIDPRNYPIPDLKATHLDGTAASLDDYRGKWIMLLSGNGPCDAVCEEKLYKMRQIDTMQGREAERVERVWVRTDKEVLDTTLLKKYDGMHVLQVDGDVLAKWLPGEEGTQLSDHIFMIDPLGNLMMRFPKDGDPQKIYKDISKLLRASSIG